MKRTEVGKFVNGKLTRGIIEQFEATDQTFVTSGNADGTTNTLNFTNSTGGTFTVTNSALLFNDGNEGYWSSTAHNNIIASGDSTTHIMIPGTLGMTGNTFVGGDIIQPSVDSIFNNGDYLEIGTGYANSGEITFNANHDGGVGTNTYTPVVSHNANAGMTVIKMPSGGHGGLDFHVKNHGTTSGSQDLSTFTKILELNQDGNSTFGGRVGIGTSPGSSLHITTADNVITKFVSTDSIATIELGDNSTSNQAILTRVSNDLKICKDGGNIGIPISPKTKLDVQHNPTSLSNNTGGGESVTFGTASGSLTQGKLYYLNTSGVWTLTQANASSSNGNSQLLGIALGTSVSDGLLIRGFFDMNSYLTGTFNEGISLYVCETTAGNINVAAPGAANEFIRVVGYATNTSKVIYFNPDGTYITLS